MALNTVNARVEAVGAEAKAMVGRTPGCIAAIKPMRDGVIADFDAAEKMLDYFIKKAHGKRRFVRPRVVIGVPSGITQVERRAVRTVPTARGRARVSGGRRMAAAIGAGLPITEACGNMIVDIGGGTTDICVISLAGMSTAAVPRGWQTRWTRRLRTTSSAKKTCSLATGPPNKSRSSLARPRPPGAQGTGSQGSSCRAGQADDGDAQRSGSPRPSRIRSGRSFRPCGMAWSPRRRFAADLCDRGLVPAVAAH